MVRVRLFRVNPIYIFLISVNNVLLASLQAYFARRFLQKECPLIMFHIFLIKPPFLPSSFQERPRKHDHWISCHSLSPLLLFKRQGALLPRSGLGQAFPSSWAFPSSCMAGHATSSLWAVGSCISQGESSTTTPLPLQVLSPSPTNIEMIKIKLQDLCEQWHKVGSRVHSVHRIWNSHNFQILCKYIIKS